MIISIAEFIQNRLDDWSTPVEERHFLMGAPWTDPEDLIAPQVPPQVWNPVLTVLKSQTQNPMRHPDTPNWLLDRSLQTPAEVLPDGTVTRARFRVRTEFLSHRRYKIRRPWAYFVLDTNTKHYEALASASGGSRPGQGHYVSDGKMHYCKRPGCKTLIDHRGYCDVCRKNIAQLKRYIREFNQ